MQSLMLFMYLLIHHYAIPVRPDPMAGSNW